MAQISDYKDEHQSTMQPCGSHEMNFWHRVVAVYMGVLPDLEHDLQESGKISFFEFQVLDHLCNVSGAMSMSKLATRCNSSLSRLSHVARKLEERGLLTRQLSATDRRVTVAEVTEAGRELMSRLRGVYHHTVEHHMVQSLSADELRQAIELMDHMLRRNEPDHWLFST